ncbi:MAG: uroporphyrinogen-III synthase [Wolbachia endosymbiont of Fragariocoptes setiger]|nr:uroporphyrinogen-III synthase [Wolbachia endosymbiont of Fragariocoptes setiger]
MRFILLTRPLCDSLHTKSILQKYGHKVYIEPMLTIKYICSSLSLNEFDVVISTSKNSIKSLYYASKGQDLPLITVGSATMETAKELGFTNVVSADNNVEALISLIKAHYSSVVKFLYIRGQKVSCNLKKRLSIENFNVKEIILYKTIAKKHLTSRCRKLFLDKIINSVVFFSTHTAKVFCSLVNKGGFSHLMSNVSAYSMSKNIADNLKQIRWKKIITSRLPTQESLIDAINKC